MKRWKVFNVTLSWNRTNQATFLEKVRAIASITESLSTDFKRVSTSGLGDQLRDTGHCLDISSSSTITMEADNTLKRRIREGIETPASPQH